MSNPKSIGTALLLGLFFSLFFSPAGEGEEPRVYALSDCLAVAHVSSPVIRDAVQEVEVATGRKLQALSDALPHLNAEAGYTYLDRVSEIEFEGESIPTNLQDNYSVALTVEQNIYQGGEVLAGIEGAILYHRYSEATLEDARERVDFRIKDLFYRLLLAEGVVQVRRDTVEHMRDYHETTRRKYEEGSTSEFELITARVKLANASPPLIEAENRVEILKTSLAREMGIGEQNFRVKGELTYLPFPARLDRLSEAGQESRALLRMARLNKELFEENLQAQYAGYQPHLSLFAAYEGERPQSGIPPEDEFQFEWQAGATLTWSLFDGLMTPGRVQEAQGLLEQARINAEDTDRLIQLEIKQAYLNLKSAQRTLDSQKEVVEQAEKAYQIASIRWQNGISTYLELTDAELDLSEAKINHREALANYRIALAELERSVGLTLEEMIALIEKPGGEEKDPQT